MHRYMARGNKSGVFEERVLHKGKFLLPTLKTASSIAMLISICLNIISNKFL